MLCPLVCFLGVPKPGKLGNRTSANGKNYVEESETDRTEQRPCQQVIGLLSSHAHIQLKARAEAVACCLYAHLPQPSTRSLSAAHGTQL